MTKKFFKKQGFTLVELIVVTAIIGILAIIIFPSYQSARGQLALNRAASQLAQDIRRVQEMAMSVKREELCLSTVGYKYGFGISLSSPNNSYILFADCNGNQKYQSSADKVLFNPNFSEVTVDYTAYNNLDITFEPPDPTSSFWKNQTTSLTETFIILKAKNDSNKTKTIKVNKAGLIYVE